MNSIKTVEELVDSLNDSEPEEHSGVIKKIDIPPGEFESYASWSEEDYTRNCIERTDSYELILLCWDSGAETQIHGHGGQDCWVYQISGDVAEIRFEKNDEDELKESHSMILKPGNRTYMHDRMGYHLIKNKSDQRAMTLHIYANPIDECEVYNEEKERFEVAELQYDTFDGEPIRISAAG